MFLFCYFGNFLTSIPSSVWKVNNVSFNIYIKEVFFFEKKRKKYSFWEGNNLSIENKFQLKKAFKSLLVSHLVTKNIVGCLAFCSFLVLSKKLKWYSSTAVCKTFLVFIPRMFFI